MKSCNMWQIEQIRRIDYADCVGLFPGLMSKEKHEMWL